MAVSLLQSGQDPTNLCRYGKDLGIPNHCELKLKTNNRLLDHLKLQALIAERFTISWSSLSSDSAEDSLLVNSPFQDEVHRWETIPSLLVHLKEGCESKGLQ